MNPRVTRSDTTRALTEREVAELLGLSVATLRAWRHQREGAAFPAARAIGSIRAVRRGRLRSREHS